MTVEEYLSGLPYTFELNNHPLAMSHTHTEVFAIPGNSGRLIVNRDAIGEVLVPCMRQRHTLPAGVVKGRIRSPCRISHAKQPPAVEVISDALRVRHGTSNKEDNKESSEPTHAAHTTSERHLTSNLAPLAFSRTSCVHYGKQALPHHA